MTVRDRAAASVVPRGRVPGTVRWAIALGVAAGVLVAAVVPGDGGTLGTGPLGLVGFDKWLHGLAYAALAGALAWADGRPVVAALAAIGYGVLLELLQSQVPRRSTSALDAAPNGVGALIGVALLVALTWAYRRYVAAASARSTPEK